MPNIQVISVPEEEDTKKRHEKIREEIIVESFPTMGNTPRHILNTPRHPKTHVNQTNKDQTQRTYIKSSKGETTNNTQRGSHKDNN